MRVRRTETGSAAVADVMRIRSGWEANWSPSPILPKKTTPKSLSCLFQSHPGPQYTTSYTVAFLSPEPVTMYLSSGETSQLSTDEDSLDCDRVGVRHRHKPRQERQRERERCVIDGDRRRDTITNKKMLEKI